MLLAIECMIACIIFALIILPTQYKNPIKYIMSYPPEIRKRVESLPEYKNTVKSTEKGHILKKLIAVFVCITLLRQSPIFQELRNLKQHFHMCLSYFLPSISLM
mgnify:CR=1 FL=1